MPVWLFCAKENENRNNCSLFLHLCDTEKRETPPWNSVKKAVRATWQQSSSGLKWLQYSGIIHDSGILREASGYTAPCVIFTFHHQKSEGELWESQSSRTRAQLHDVNMKLFHFMCFPLSAAPWNTKGNKIELFEMGRSALFFLSSSQSRGRLYPLYDSDKCHRLALTLNSVPLSIVGGIS